MKVLNLRCSRLHSFEGWFGSEEDFQNQLGRGLIACPACADTGVEKMPSAPRLNLGATPLRQADTVRDRAASASSAGFPPKNAGAPSGQTDGAVKAGASSDAQGAAWAALRQMMANTEDLGERFADEARRIHYGEAEARAIRGEASVREAAELLEEGIEIVPLPMLDGLKGTLQ